MRNQRALRHARGLTLVARPRTRGFTLVEIMVVVVIIGIITAGALLSMSFLGPDRELDAEGERIAALINYAGDQASLQTRELGMFFTRTGYLFMAFDPRTGQWVQVTNDDALRPRTLPDGLALQLNVEGHDLVLPASAPPPASAPASPAAASLSFASAPPAVASGPMSSAPGQSQPQVMIFSNGDLSTFRIQLTRDGTDHVVQVAPDAQGHTSASEPQGSS